MEGKKAGNMYFKTKGSVNTKLRGRLIYIIGEIILDNRFNFLENGERRAISKDKR